MNTEKIASEIEAAMAARATEKRRLGAINYLAGTDLEMVGVDTPNLRDVVKEFSKRLKEESAEDMLKLVLRLVEGRKLEVRQVGYEMLARHKAAFAALTVADLERLGAGNDNWASVDGISCELIGPLWLAGGVPDEAIMKWAHSENLWWRRTAIVSTTGLNKKSRGGKGDPKRTLAICRLFVADRHKMITKALSWALRELSKSHPKEVLEFVMEHEDALAGHVKREVHSKIVKGTKR